MRLSTYVSPSFPNSDSGHLLIPLYRIHAALCSANSRIDVLSLVQAVCYNYHNQVPLLFNFKFIERTGETH